MIKVQNLTQFINESLLKVFEKARSMESYPHLHTRLDIFFDRINFATEEESLRPENVNTAKQAFRDLCREMNWIAVEQSFEELLEEKSGKYATRSKDKTVPNWYHEFRNILPSLSCLRSNIYTEPELKKHGGVEALLIAKLRHDSFEDFGKTPTQIYSGLEKRYHEQNAAGLFTDDQLLTSRHQASIATDVVALVSKKTKALYLDEDGQLQTHKTDFFGGDNNEFYQGTLNHFFAYETKTIDGIEGLSTRVVPSQFQTESSKFSIDDNLKYAREKRSLYGRTAMDAMAIEKWPRFREGIRSLDSMLRLNLVTLEVVNDYYAPNSKLKARNAFPMRVNRYNEHAMDAYKHVPPGYNPIKIQVERLEKIAASELERGQYKMAEILENAIYPSLIKIIGDRRGTLISRSDLNPYHNPNDNHNPV